MKTAINRKSSFSKENGKNDDKKLTKSEIDEFKDLYKKYDSAKQGVSKHDLILLLKGKKYLLYYNLVMIIDAGHYVEDSTKKKIYELIEIKGQKKVDLPLLLEIASLIKTFDEEEDDINDEYGMVILIFLYN